MNKNWHLTSLIAVTTLLSSWAQSTDIPIALARPAGEEDSLVLDTFTVRLDKDIGYVGTDSLIGGRIATTVQKTPSDVTVLTRQFLSDIAIDNNNDAAAWLPNTIVLPVNANLGSIDFGTAANFRGISSGYPARNFFRSLSPVDSYIIERVEGARGPNAMLFADGVVGGVLNTTTKRAKIERDFAKAQVRLDSEGSIRGTFDINQSLGSKAAVRVNLVNQEKSSWIDTAKDKFTAGDITAAVRVNPTGEIRAEAEFGKQKTLYPSTYFSDNGSRWDGTTTVNAKLTATPASTTGIAQLRPTNSLSTQRLVYGPAYTSVGVQDYANWGTSSGTALPVVPGEREFQDTGVFPRIARDFNLKPKDAYSKVDYRVFNAVYEQAIGADWALELSASKSIINRDSPSITPNGIAIDVNTVLPNGQANPNLRQPYAEATNTQQSFDNDLTEYRVAGVYTVPIESFKQRFILSSGYRKETFSDYRAQFGRINGTAPILNASNPRSVTVATPVFLRYYLKDGPQNINLPKDGNGYTFGYIPTNDLNQVQELTHVQLASVTSLDKDRLNIIAGVRRDFYKESNTGVTGRDIATGLPNARGNTGKNSSTADSKQLGAVYFPIRELGVYANYSETFNPVTAGPSMLSGKSFTLTKGEGWAFGVRLNLLNGKIVGSVGRYHADEKNRITQTALTSVAEINRIWTNLNRPDRLESFRDTQNYSSDGYEMELVGNITPALRVFFNASLPETKQEKTAPEWKNYIATNLPLWQAGADNPANVNATAIRNDITALNSRLATAANGRQLNGTAKYTANLLANYTVQTGTLRRLRFLAGVNSVGRQIIGNQSTNGFDYLYASERFNVLAGCGYWFAIRDVTIDIQLNVTNVLDEKNPIYTGAATYLTDVYRGAYYLPEPRRYALTTTVRF